MPDIKITYEELLQANKKLTEEVERLRSVNGIHLQNNNADNRVYTPVNTIREIFDTVSSYLALFRITEDRRIKILDLNDKAALIESVRRSDTKNRYLDETPLGNKERLVRLIIDTKKTGCATKLSVSDSDDESLGNYIGFSIASGSILVTWEPSTRQKSEDDFSKQNLIFENFADMLPEMIYEVDLSGNVIYGNIQVLKFFGYSKQDLAEGFHISKVFPENYQQMIENLRNLDSPDQVSSNEYYATKKDGSPVPILTHSFALFHNNHKIGYRGIVSDISKQKIYEDQINREKAFLEHLVDSIPEAIVIMDRDGRITSINKEFTSMFGYTTEEALGRTVDELITPDHLRKESDTLEELVRENGRMIKNTLRHDKSGNLIQVSLTATNLLINSETAASLGIYRNVTQERKVQTIQEILYNISTAALNQIDIKDIYPTIVKELSKIWDTNNFFIALYDARTDTLSMPLFSDEQDQFENVPARKTITKWVIGLRKSVLLKLNDLKDLENSGDIALVGTPCKVWMGVPLKAEREIIGVMALQDYHDENKFTQEDVNVLEFIANQIAIAIQRRTMIDNMIQASRKAEEAAQSKQQFMSTMSHEIRTPLNEVIGITNLLLQGNPREDQMDFIKTLRFSGNHLLTLVNDVLDYNKMESGKIVFEQTPFSLTDFMNDILRTYSFRSRSKNIEFEIIRDDNLPDEVIGDPIRLNQILSNLLSNALKFTKSGYIHVTLKEIERKDNKANVEFVVKDTGMGIPRDKHSMIFESFTQASPDTTRHFGGTGLGLAICKKLVELQGGRIDVDSEPGKGSAFSFVLSFGISEQGIRPKAGEASETYVGLEGKRILVAEDNKINFFVANKFLSGWGVKVTHVENGQLAVEMLEKADFDLVLMDLHMPVMDGIEATRMIRKSSNPEISNIPVVALTAAIMSENHDKIADLSINDYVLKPFKPHDLFDKILKNIR
jgi:PAS domain S-box-containing protein